MRKKLLSLVIVGMCFMSHPMPVMSVGPVESNVGVGKILTPELTDEEKEELLNIAASIIFYQKRMEHSIENAIERSTIMTDQDEDVELGYSNRWGITELTDEELELLADIVWLEAGNQGVVGQEYVVTVILNRTLDPDFEDKIIDVLSTDGQFVTWKNRYKAQPTEETYQAIEDVLSGKADESVTNSQFLYFNTKSGDYKYLGHYFSY